MAALHEGCGFAADFLAQLAEIAPLNLDNAAIEHDEIELIVAEEVNPADHPVLHIRPLRQRGARHPPPQFQPLGDSGGQIPVRPILPHPNRFFEWLRCCQGGRCRGLGLADALGEAGPFGRVGRR